MSTYCWYLNSDNVVWIRGLTDPVQNKTVTNATITGQVRDKNGTNIGDSISFTHVADGDYYGIVPHDLPFVNGETYTMVISIQGAGLQLELNLVGRVAKRWA